MHLRTPVLFQVLIHPHFVLFLSPHPLCYINSCGEEPHSPSSCEQQKLWLEKCQGEGGKHFGSLLKTAINVSFFHRDIQIPEGKYKGLPEVSLPR